jgi:hypothetical protein
MMKVNLDRFLDDDNHLVTRTNKDTIAAAISAARAADYEHHADGLDPETIDPAFGCRLVSLGAVEPQRRSSGPLHRTMLIVRLVDTEAHTYFIVDLDEQMQLTVTANLD